MKYVRMLNQIELFFLCKTFNDEKVTSDTGMRTLNKFDLTAFADSTNVSSRNKPKPNQERVNLVRKWCSIISNNSSRISPYGKKRMHRKFFSLVPVIHFVFPSVSFFALFMIESLQQVSSAHLINSVNPIDTFKDSRSAAQLPDQHSSLRHKHHRQNHNQQRALSNYEYDYSYNEEDYEDRLDQPSYSSPNCTWCQFREEVKSFRIQEIKAHILKSLGIKKTPNMTGRPSLKRQIPNLINLMGMQKESVTTPHTTEDDDERVKTKRVLIFSQENPYLSPILKRYNVKFFKISRKISKDKVAKANLWLYMKSNELSGSIRIQLYNVHIEKDESPTLTQIPEKFAELNLESKSARWITVDVRKVVSEWFKEHPLREEFGLGIQIKDANNNLLQDDKIVIVSDYEDKSNNSIQKPFLEIYTESIKRHRSRRSAGMTCQENSQETRCCRYPLTVDFVEFGWDWIIAPTKYEANYCAGDCPFVFLQKFPHAHIVQQAKPGGKAGPCCAPRKMSPISMLYFNNLYNVVYSTLPGMIVDKCGCA